MNKATIAVSFDANTCFIREVKEILFEFLANRYPFEQHHTIGKISIASANRHMPQRANRLRQPTNRHQSTWLEQTKFIRVRQTNCAEYYVAHSDFGSLFRLFDSLKRKSETRISYFI